MNKILMPLLVLGFVACSEFSYSRAKPSNTAQNQRLVIQNKKANDIVARLRKNEQSLQIAEITTNDMYNVATRGSEWTLQDYVNMLKYMDEIIATLREIGYNQAQITAAYQGGFYSYANQCQTALRFKRNTPSFITEKLPYCEYYADEFKEKVEHSKMYKNAKSSQDGTAYAYSQNEIPVLVSIKYNQNSSDEDLHQAQVKLKRLGDEDLKIEPQRKAKLDEFVDSLQISELHSIINQLDTAIKELRLSHLTQEQASVVMSDVFFRYANLCERLKNTNLQECELYFQHYAPQISLKEGQRNYLKYSRKVIPARVVIAYTANIAQVKSRCKEKKTKYRLIKCFNSSPN